MSLKKTDQIFVVSVGVLRGGILFGEHQLNEMSPEAYTLVREGLSSLGQVLSKVMVGIRKADGGLHELFGSIYDIPKEIVEKEIKEFKEGAPKFVKGLTAFFLGERITSVTLKGAGAIGKGALKVTKQAKREVEIFVRNAANKFDKLAKTGTRTLEGLGKSRIAVTPEGVPFWKFADDATCKNPTLFSVIEDTKFKSKGSVGEVKTKVGGQEEAGVLNKVKDISGDTLKTDISLSVDSILKDKAKFIAEYDFYHPGELVEKYAQTFTGYKYKKYILMEDTIMYRAGSKDFALGDYFSFTSPVSEIQVRMDKALKHVWPDGHISIIDSIHEIKFPKGTHIYVGDVANQGVSYFGGTHQIVIPSAKNIKGVELIKSYPIKKE